jgi:SCP-2 sterol transfer family
MIAVPDCLQTLVDRFDPSVFDAPAGRARIRVVMAEEAQWDVLVGAGEVRVAAADRSSAPDATLSADRDTWEGIAADLRGGMDAYRAGRLIVRHNLHLGVGFLAATSETTGPGRLRFQRIETGSGALSILTAGAGEPILLVHGLGATKGSFLPTVAALAGSFRTIALDLPGFGDSFKPLGARLPPARLRPLRRGVDGRAGDRPGARRREQHGWARRARARPATPRARRSPGPALHTAVVEVVPVRGRNRVAGVLHE